jgi:hypothetical protein
MAHSEAMAKRYLVCEVPFGCVGYLTTPLVARLYGVILMDYINNELERI